MNTASDSEEPNPEGYASSPCYAHEFDDTGWIGSIRLKRIHDPADSADGYRVLVDRLWPRGVAKADAKIDAWAKELAPSRKLRQWFGHDPEKWPEFCQRYTGELSQREEAGQALESLRAQSRRGPVTLLYAAKDRHHNNAAAFKGILESC